MAECTSSDSEAVVGDECHIISGQSNGPRYDPLIPASEIDDYTNLLVLCRVHHKIIDDQQKTYTVEKLQEIKAKHENWILNSLSKTNDRPRLRVRRIKAHTPSVLPRIRSGSELFAIIDKTHGSEFANDEPLTTQEMMLIRDFFQDAQDYGDLSGDLEAGQHVEVIFKMNQSLRDLEVAGFWVFGVRETRQIEGGDLQPAPWYMAVLRVVRAKNDSITKATPTSNEVLILEPF